MKPESSRLMQLLTRLAPALAAVTVLAAPGVELRAQNLLVNPDFDANLNDWQASPVVRWDGTRDAETGH